MFGLTPSPAILASTIKHHLSKYEEKEPEVTSLLGSSLYVDDLAGGVFRENETVNLYDEAQKIMKDGGFSLRQWNSNCQSFQEKIKQDEERKGRLVMEATPKESEITQNLNKEESQSAKDGKLETATSEDTRLRAKINLIHEAEVITSRGDHEGLPLFFGVITAKEPFCLVTQFHGIHEQTSLFNKQQMQA